MNFSQIPTAITPDDVKHAIAYERFFNAADAVQGAFDAGRLWSTDYDTDTTKELSPLPPYGSLEQLTFCVLVLRSGIKVVGINYGSIDPTQQNAEKARAMARKQAEDKVWEILGNDLRQRQERARQSAWVSSQLASSVEMNGHRFAYSGGDVLISDQPSKKLKVIVPSTMDLTSEEGQIELRTLLERLITHIEPQIREVRYLELQVPQTASEYMHNCYPPGVVGKAMFVGDFCVMSNNGTGELSRLGGLRQLPQPGVGDDQTPTNRHLPLAGA